MMLVEALVLLLVDESVCDLRFSPHE
jgi:hypothetical protein